MTSLRTLNLGHAQISDAQLESLAGLPQLESLSMQVDIDVQRAKASLEMLHEVRRVLTIATPLRAVLPAAPPEFPDASSPRPATIERRGLAPLAQFLQLKRLRLTGNAVTNYDMQFVASIPHLQHLDLTGCASVSDHGLESLVMLKELRTLKLEQTSVSTTGVAKIKKALPNCAVTW